MNSIINCSWWGSNIIIIISIIIIICGLRGRGLYDEVVYRGTYLYVYDVCVY